jgi:dynein heavy chain 2
MFPFQAVTENKGKGLDWEIVHGLMVDAIYGGRIDNAFDIRVLKAYLR